ncbi:MAG: peptidylprolyl isomerase [Halieaceae bacterium]|nr:peptidylprolyl isomerase [Halieaceae bacterium]
MNISKDSVISFHYNLLDQQGNCIETTRDGDPSLYLHGTDNLLAGLESAMEGHSVGDSFEVTLEPHLAYGFRQHDRQQRVAAKYLKHEGKLSKGQIVRIHSDQGAQVATVIKVGKFSVDVDLNHPLVDQTITYQVEILHIRTASPEEISHAHGIGGHDH